MQPDLKVRFAHREEGFIWSQWAAMGETGHVVASSMGSCSLSLQRGAAVGAAGGGPGWGRVSGRRKASLPLDPGSGCGTGKAPGTSLAALAKPSTHPKHPRWSPCCLCAHQARIHVPSRKRACVVPAVLSQLPVLETVHTLTLSRRSDPRRCGFTTGHRAARRIWPSGHTKCSHTNEPPHTALHRGSPARGLQSALSHVNGAPHRTALSQTSVGASWG